MPRRFTFIRLLFAVLLASLAGGCGEGALPDPSSEKYRQAVTAFYTGVAAIQVGEDRRAEARLTEVTEIAPGEPAAWANLGLLALRRQQLDKAGARLEEAREHAPDNPRILLLSGLLAREQGQPDEAIEFLRRARRADPNNLKATYALAGLVEETDAASARALLDTLQTLQPDNLALLLERARLAAAQEDADAFRATVDRLVQQSGDWPVEAQEQLRTLEAADLSSAATPLAFLTNVLKRVPAYRDDLAALQSPPEQLGELIPGFLRLPSPSPSPALPDTTLAFAPEALPVAVPAGPWTWLRALVLREDGPPLFVAANGREVWIEPDTRAPFPGGNSATPPSPAGIVALDYDYDFEADLALAGAGGLRLLQQQGAGEFVDVTAQVGLTAAVLGAAYTGVWTADLDMEGDLDLVLGTRRGPPTILRNDGDGTFSVWDLFGEIDGLTAFAWADLDADGDPDAALLDAAGRLHIFTNERSRGFQPRPLPALPGATVALDVADLDNDGLFDLLLLDFGGVVKWRSGATGQTEAIAQWPGLAAPLGDEAQLVAVDLDNNGALDLAAFAGTGAQVWLADAQHRLQPHTTLADGRFFSAADVTGDGRLDLLGVTEDGATLRLANLGEKNYHSKSIRPRAAQVIGDRRINPFGLGGEIEVRAGLLFQKQPITAPSLHFGLGDHAEIDVARITWPNGDVQAEFELLSDELALTRQRLKGSCPWVFTYDGEGMHFVTDFLWRSPLGLAINAQETAGVMMTEDRVKIRGDQLIPRDGFYDVRITAELWETHFFDHVSLLVVDHPVETEIFVDERFAFPPPDLDVRPTAPPRPVAQAWDERGEDVTDRLRTRDGRYLDTFGLGPYQGVAQEHFVEVDLGDDVPEGGPLWLVAEGWLRPTDSSINIALSQGGHAPPQGLRLEAPDGAGGWQVVHPNLGFPAGKNKTILIDLKDVFKPGTPRRLRLHTNLEIYWDALGWAAGLPDTLLQTQRLLPATADLRYRGFSEVYEPNRSTPETPAYDELAGTAPVWRDLIGYYTRFGDVRALLEEIDDRYVIMNAGDEMAFRFPAPPPPPEGWTRDFVLIGDGWVKDGDYNTTFSKTVLPLPAHDRPAYSTPPTRLEDDPVYRRHADDWQTYHTRYVTPERFRRALSTK